MIFTFLGAFVFFLTVFFSDAWGLVVYKKSDLSTQWIIKQVLLSGLFSTLLYTDNRFYGKYYGKIMVKHKKSLWFLWWNYIRVFFRYKCNVKFLRMIVFLSNLLCLRIRIFQFILTFFSRNGIVLWLKNNCRIDNKVNFILILFYKYSYIIFRYSDKGWFEFFGPMGVTRLFYYFGGLLSRLSGRNLYEYLLYVVLFFILLFLIVV